MSEDILIRRAMYQIGFRLSVAFHLLTYPAFTLIAKHVPSEFATAILSAVGVVWLLTITLMLYNGQRAYAYPEKPEQAHRRQMQGMFWYAFVVFYLVSFAALGLIFTAFLFPTTNGQWIDFGLERTLLWFSMVALSCILFVLPLLSWLVPMGPQQPFFVWLLIAFFRNASIFLVVALFFGLALCLLNWGFWQKPPQFHY